MKSFILILSCACAVIPAFSGIAFADGASRAESVNCGMLSLWILLNGEDQSVEIDKITSLLSSTHPHGNSAEEIRTAAAACGVPLVGVRLVPGKKPMEKPALVFFKRDSGGHFVVLRPVGRTGEFVQLIDPGQNTTDIQHVWALPTLPGWTGVALEPRRGSAWLRIIGGIAMISGLCVAATSRFKTSARKRRLLAGWWHGWRATTAHSLMRR